MSATQPEPVGNARWQVCVRCEGEGAVDNENFNGFTAADRAEFDDFDRTYREGWLSVQCPACKGRRVMTPEQTAEWEAAEEERWVTEQEYRAESLSYWMGL